MKLEKFTKNKKQKRIIIGSTIGLILLIGGIYLYRTYALYEEKKEFNVLKGKVPDFSNWSIDYYVDGVKTSKPSKGSVGYKGSTCTGVTGVTWDNTNWEISYNVSNLTNKNVTCTVDFVKNFSNYLINLSNIGGFGIRKQTHEATEQTGSNATTDYRYVGMNPNNYVCLESSGTCTTNQLYRIIGVIPTQSSTSGAYENRVKLIKATEYSTDYWSGSSRKKTNNWTTSTLNTSTLNATYWNSISSYQQYIGDTKWYLGGYNGGDSSKTDAIDRIYKSERSTKGAGSAPTTISSVSKIALMYLSDYLLANSNEVCLQVPTSEWGPGEAYEYCSAYDWLYYTSDKEWVIDPHSTQKDYSIGKRAGKPAGNAVYYKFVVRPVFHLKSNILYESGDGSQTNPYRLSI